MAKFGFKYQEISEEIEIDDEYISGKCIYCGKETELILEHGDVVKVQIPVCKKHYEKTWYNYIIQLNNKWGFMIWKMMLWP